MMKKNERNRNLFIADELLMFFFLFVYFFFTELLLALLLHHKLRRFLNLVTELVITLLFTPFIIHCSYHLSSHWLKAYC